MTDPTFALVGAWRSDGGRRDELKAFTERWWQQNGLLPEGHTPTVAHRLGDGPFRRAEGINTAAADVLERRPDVAVLVLVDLDVIASAEQVREAVARAHETGRMTLAFDRYLGLNRATTDRVLAGKLHPERHSPLGLHTTADRSDADHVSSIVAVPVDLWHLTGGLDERMVGWGYEDTAFAHACTVIAGGIERVPGDVLHLWHEPSPERRAAIRRDSPNRTLRDRYLKASSPVELAAILERPEHLLRTFTMPTPAAAEVEHLIDEHGLPPAPGDIAVNNIPAKVTPPRPAILVPYRADGGERDRLWAFALERWKAFHPDWPVYLGASPDGPFNRSAAINDAARQAIAADPTVNVYVVIDADVLADPRAVRRAVDLALAGRGMIVSHNERLMLNERGTRQVLDGYEGSWREPRMLDRTASGSNGTGIYRDSVSCCVAVARSVFELVGGFDELFVGWGYEDTAFQIAVETLTDSPVVWLESQLFHLWHAKQPTARRGTPTFVANGARVQKYRDARWDVPAVTRLTDEHVRARNNVASIVFGPSVIPRMIHRTLPEAIDERAEAWWQTFVDLHPGWELRTWREPLDPKLFPRTAPLWKHCQNGAQKAGLVRLELLEALGGVYVDSDVECFRNLEPLVHVPAFIGWEDERCAPDAVIGARKGHPGITEAIKEAGHRIGLGGDAWATGPGVSTDILAPRDDVLDLAPGSLYQVHYHELRKLSDPPKPWEFVRHHWVHSWGTPEQKAANARKQR